ncbi:AHH domain-containing protein [Kallotenue papyrolyticum]|uniref:AHH domain-containing protein n=1 Tax=Kallotenue papyrolyticum TaxID=1325125 RepID=UPI000478659B|nr:AHH domain-containing protein [Kallotenue papyrolyticum]
MLGKVDDLARTGDRLADGSRVVRRLPCVGAAPVPKVAGLAKPLDACSPSAILAANMGAVGIVRPAQTAAHHIVAAGSPKAAQVRRILARFGIDINDAHNGVFLPDTPTRAVPGMYHRTFVYYREINSRLAEATTREHALEILDDIRSELLNGTFPR